MIAVMRSMLGLSCFILVGSALMAMVAQRGSAEFVVSVLGIVFGLIALAGSVLLARWSLQRPQFKEE